MLGRRLQDVVIIDNSPISYLFQPHHAIPISSWYSDPSDKNLFHLIPVLKELALHVQEEGLWGAPLSYHLKKVKGVLKDTPPQIVTFTELPVVWKDWSTLVKTVKTQWTHNRLSDNFGRLNEDETDEMDGAERKNLQQTGLEPPSLQQSSAQKRQETTFLLPTMPPPPPPPTQIL